jgi:exopolysaccharide biosynthesis polyprenyl glycosylphosphotransferase
MGNEKTHKAATGKQPLSISWHSAGLLLFIGDIFTLSILYELAHYIRLGTLINLVAIPFVIVTSTLVLMLFLFDTYRVEAPVTRSRLPLTAAFASLLTIITSSSLVYFYGPLHFESIFGRGIMPVVLVLFSFWAYWSRYSLSLWSESKQGENKWLFIGSKEKLSYFLDDFKIDKKNIIILNEEKSDNSSQQYSENSSYLSNKLCDLSSASLNTVTDVVIATDMPFNEKAVSVLMKLRAMGSFIYDLTTFYEQHLSKVPVLHLKHGWFLNSSGFYLLQNAFGIKLKRLLDILISTFLLLLLSPIMLFVSMLIKLDTHGPVFYSQTRTGLNGENFLLHKFRTMCVDAEKNGAVWANKNDARITRVGRVLRKSRIDELPQLWNVLKSEMSFIGPRPERPEFIEDLEKQIPFYELRHLIKPGITGWAQVMYPYGASLEDAQEKLEYDLFYIKKYSLLLDFSILMKTLRVILRHQGR